MTSPLVSIVVTVYNKCDFIAQTLRSALDQTHRDLEVIAVNDGSTDDSLAVIQPLAQDDERLRLIDQPNAGVAAARNRGLAAARGRFVNILDGDDLLYPAFIARTAEFLTAHPSVDVVHTSWDRIDERGRRLATSTAPDPDDYLHELLLGNIFAPSAMLLRRELLDRIGPVRDGLAPTEDWEYVIRMARAGAVFARLPDVLAAYREVKNSARKVKNWQSNRFFPVIDLVFDESLPPAYARLRDLSIIRHRLFLMEDMLAWGFRREARQHFDLALRAIAAAADLRPDDVPFLRPFFPRLSAPQMSRLLHALRARGLAFSAPRLWAWRAYDGPLGRAAARPARRALQRAHAATRRAFARTDARLERLIGRAPAAAPALQQGVSLADIRRRSLAYADSLRLTRHGRFLGYRHSAATTRPVLYATLAALLLRHLHGRRDDPRTPEELAFVARHQSDDGLFRDPVIACPAADNEDWWGWRHLTLHSLNTLALYDTPAPRELRYPFLRFRDLDGFHRHLASRDFGPRVAWTSNELQNYGVMLQYARDYECHPDAPRWLDALYETLDQHQDRRTGLYGHRFDSPPARSLGVQAGYHFWLLYFYDRRRPRHLDRIIDSVLATQNPLGGYGVPWHSSACEDIDSIDPLARITRLTDYRRADVQLSLRRALPAVLANLNPDGGWVFRRHEALTVGHKQMYSGLNESNLFYTWFRMLGLACCLLALDDKPLGFDEDWTLPRAPGMQFSLD